MLRYIGLRLLQMLPVVLVVTFVIFSITLLLPGDPAVAMLGEQSTQQQREALREEMGLNLPLPVQYARWLGNVATGDFGPSLRRGEPVTEMLVRRAPVTVELSILAVLFGVIVGIP